MWSHIRDLSLLMGLVGMLAWILFKPSNEVVIRDTLTRPSEISLSDESATISQDSIETGEASKASEQSNFRNKQEELSLPKKVSGKNKKIAQLSPEIRAKIKQRLMDRMADMEYRSASREERKKIREQLKQELLNRAVVRMEPALTVPQDLASQDLTSEAGSKQAVKPAVKEDSEKSGWFSFFRSNKRSNKKSQEQHQNNNDNNATLDIEIAKSDKDAEEFKEARDEQVLAQDTQGTQEKVTSLSEIANVGRKSGRGAPEKRASTKLTAKSSKAGLGSPNYSDDSGIDVPMKKLSKQEITEMRLGVITGVSFSNENIGETKALKASVSSKKSQSLKSLKKGKRSDSNVRVSSNSKKKKDSKSLTNLDREFIEAKLRSDRKRKLELQAELSKKAARERARDHITKDAMNDLEKSFEEAFRMDESGEYAQKQDGLAKVAHLSVPGKTKKSELEMASDFFEEVDGLIDELEREP